MGLTQEEVIHGLLAERAKLLAYIRSIVLNQHAAEDIHQDVVVAALQNADTIANRCHLLAWAKQAARFRAIDYLRARQRQPRHVDPDVLDLLEPDWNTEANVSAPSMIEALRQCLRKLTPRARMLVELRFGDKLDGTQISEKLGIKLPSVYMAYSRIYGALDNCIRGRLAGGRQR